jgi:DMSO/TMAO reductase YedYZ molybdopterin-dependent catalytic subunit
MNQQNIPRRNLLKSAGTLFGLSALRVAGPEHVLGQPGAEVIPWLDQPPPNPVPNVTSNLLRWENLESRITPAHDFFYVNHYGIPGGLNEANWRVNITGLVARPRSLTLDDLKARARHEVEFTLECSGNNGLDFFIGGIGNARWAGVRLAPLLEQAEVLGDATEVIFRGIDSGNVTIRDNSGVVSGGRTGLAESDGAGGLDLTITEQFARSMSLRDALNRDNLLCYEMNGEPLPPEHGFPVRLIAPGWYGVANVKWLTGIEVVDRRYAGRFMARDYVSIREELRDGQTAWTFTTVGRGRLKSAPAKAVRRAGRYMITGVAWGAPISRVEVQIDGGAWTPATLETFTGEVSRGYSWRFWTFDWGMPSAGEHTIRSRATTFDGERQPAPDDAFLASKRTYWESNGQISRRLRIP